MGLRARRLARLNSLVVVVLLVPATILATVAATSGSARDLPRSPANRCKIVTKTVHGKKKRVRVCKPTKPALPQAGSVAATIPIGAAIQQIATSDDAVWVLSGDRRLFRVDPATNRVVATIALPDSEWPEPRLAVGDGAVWVPVPSPNTISQPELDGLLRIDPQTNQIVARIHVGHSPNGVAVTPDSVWAANHRSEWDPQRNDATGMFTVSRVSVASNSEIARPVVETRPKGDDPHAYWCCGLAGITFAAGSIWTTDPQDSGRGLLIRVDPATNAVLAQISFATSKAAACADVVGEQSAVWLICGPGADAENSYVARVDPQTNQIVATVNVGSPPADLALGFGSLWVTTSEFGPVGLIRIDPATNKIVARTAISLAQGVATGNGSVWVGSGTKLLRITPR